jgi:TonB family protein
LFPLRQTVFLLSLALTAAGVCRAQEATPATNDAAADRVYTREEVTQPAVIVEMPDPVLQRKLGDKVLDVSGTVKLSVVLHSTGRVGEIEVVAGLSQAQNFAAVKAARRIKFMPAVRQGLPVSQSIIAEYTFRLVTDEFGAAHELKGVSKFYVDTGGDREAREEITGEVLRLMPGLEIVDRREEAECVLLFYAYGRTDIQPLSPNKHPFDPTPPNTGTGYNAPLKVTVGRGWVIRPLSADRQRVLWYYEDTKFSAVERKPTINFARNFVSEYRKANGLPK